jgi:Kdo2-lipid IVA lauroyltransferase/acyltransferase
VNPLIVLMRLLAYLPLPLLRALGSALGMALYMGAKRRRAIVQANLAACFPHWGAAQRNAVARRHFRLFAQSLLDRSWLWHAPVAVLRKRIRFDGALSELDNPEPLVFLAPHMVGLDVGGVVLTQLRQITTACIYVPLTNAWAEEWMVQGRNRSGNVHSIARKDGPQPVLRGLRKGIRLHLSPDMDFGAEGALWVPFYGVPAATVPALSRFAKLGRARVCTLVSRLVPGGYEVGLSHAWPDFPSEDLQAATLRMNHAIEQAIDQDPAQYYWVHKRFKTRPPGAPSIYP